MKQYPIAVYPGIFKCLFILLGSLLFLGLWLVVFTRPELGHRWLAWLCLAMGVAGLVAGGMVFGTAVFAQAACVDTRGPGGKFPPHQKPL